MCYHARVSTVGKESLIPVGALGGPGAAPQKGKEAGGRFAKSPSSVFVGTFRGISSASVACPAWASCQDSGAPRTQERVWDVGTDLVFSHVLG